MSRNRLHAGDWVEVLGKEEILCTLDAQGQLESLPFMPQMFQFCGKRVKVYKCAHKTCDTVHKYVGRKMNDAVHLEGIRCDGEAYGGCHAACLIFWKVAWLKKCGDSSECSSKALNTEQLLDKDAFVNVTCTETDIWKATMKSDLNAADGPYYVCQATQLPAATTPLPWWNIQQYVDDLTSRNVSIGKMLRGLLYALYSNLSQMPTGMGRSMRWFYDKFQAAWGGLPFPRKTGIIPLGKGTPTAVLNLKPGELVRVKPYKQILATLDTTNKNRGLYFDAECVPYCGGTYRVLKRVNRIIDEKTGRLVTLKTDSVILDGVYCQARYSGHRMFCPRGIYPYWREIWLDRVPEHLNFLPGSKIDQPPGSPAERI